MAESEFPSDNCTLKQKSSNVGTVDGITAKISTLFFDLDNTLIPTRTGDTKACRKLAEVLEVQFSFTKDEAIATTQSFLKAFRRCPDNSQTSLDSWRTFLWRESLPSRSKHLAEQIYPKWLNLRYRYLALPADYLQMLKRFREAGFMLALITNGPSNAQWEKIRKLHASQYFDCVLVSGDLPWEKPNPNIFLAACNFLGVKPANCAMVGDKLETDIKGGRIAKLGATFWLPINSANSDISDVEYPPDIVLRNLLDICKHFAALSSTVAAGSTTNTLIARRRCSQISNATTSTCNSDLLHQRHPQVYRHPHAHHNHYLPLHSHHNNRKYRRGGSLPDAMECLNSDTENSSDSLFN